MLPTSNTRDRRRLLLLLLLLLCRLLGALEDRGRSHRSCGDLAELFGAGIINGRANANVHGKALPGVAFIHAAYRSDVPVVAPVCNADMAQAHRIA